MVPPEDIFVITTRMGIGSPGIQRAEARNAGLHPIMDRTTLSTKDYLAQNINGAEIPAQSKQHPVQVGVQYMFLE